MALLNELLIVTLAAQIITGPLIVYHFGRLSIVSLLTNLLILPVQPPIMIIGGLATLAGLVWLPLGQALGWLVWLPLAWTVWMVELTARLPYASLDLGTFPFWLLVTPVRRHRRGYLVGQSSTRRRANAAPFSLARNWLGDDPPVGRRGSRRRSTGVAGRSGFA